LLKIKQAYDEYIRKSAQGHSPKSPAPTYEDLSSQLHQAELEIASLRQKHEEAQQQIAKLRQEAEDRYR
jgi:TolA-binding protein